MQAETGRQALDIFEKENISFILLDLMLPDISGEEVCKRIRKASRVPIIMVAAKVEEGMLLQGLEMGADDYITNPFSPKELFARIEVVFRRSSEDPIPLFTKMSYNQDDLVIDMSKDIVLKKNQLVSLKGTIAS